ncbi:MAG: FIST N-terminal domain-containing protein [Acidiphilium sp.]|nr:FIST N-terminal domain-containing protein [Acidiphilium sp.]MDD4936462.1 FIST N-terminal domain-containing protein [Acidiphilium sp.]
MTMPTGTAYACDQNIKTAVKICQAQLKTSSPDLILAFVGGKHDPAAALGALQETFPGVALTGGSSAGAISTAGFGYTGFEIGLIAFQGADMTPQVVTTSDLLRGETQAGEDLGRLVRDRAADGSVVLLLFDNVASSSPLQLHPASQLMAGFQKGLGDRLLHVIGGGLLTDINLSDSWMIVNGCICKHAMAALIFPSNIKASTVILHGCRPVSSFFEITRIEGAEVLELNDEPALTVVERMLGLELGTTSGQQLSLVATLGQKQGDPFAPYDENNYVNRLILQANPASGSITLFEPDFAVGTRVQIMSRDNLLMLESVERGVADLGNRIAGETCLLALYIDCAGRASVMSGAATEEADLVLRSLVPAFPFMGFYSGVEIAPFAGNYSRPLDWTGVLSVFQRVG